MKRAGMRVSTDLTRRQMAQMKEAQADGKFAYFKKGRLVVEERRETRSGDRRGNMTPDNSMTGSSRDDGRVTRSRTTGGARGSGTGGTRASASSHS